ncbi:hypothetical protein [Noviherbaspirillum sp.]|uniref:hypothetical protein n=1 Tax=Noviherbaspirillum sp. TaxID=1926288 RepID=UPI0039C8D5C2
MLTGGLAALFFLFNTGQMTSEKTKLVNTADAVAYSAGVMHARTLNYLAYTNRAMLANTVAIAQLVSLSSWHQYARSTPLLGPQLGNPLKYPALYPSVLFLQEHMLNAAPDLMDGTTLQDAAERADRQIQTVLQAAQSTVHAGLPFARQEVMEEVAHANYPGEGDGGLIVEPMLNANDPFTGFVNRYDGDERGRFAEVAEIAAKRDAFQERRSWRLDALYPNCPSALLRGRTDWIERRGGTELIGYDEWRAIDTIAEHVWRPRNKTDVLCTRESELPAGMGGTTAGNSMTFDADPRHYDYSAQKNPTTTGMATAISAAPAWDYAGIPAFHDLSRQWLESEDPSLRFSVRLRRPVRQTRTSEGRSAVRTSTRFNQLFAGAAGNELVAVSTSNVYFRRPAGMGCDGSNSGSRQNCYGLVEGMGGSERGSLFNPYWQVGLVQDGGAAQARRMQGVQLP